MIVSFLHFLVFSWQLLGLFASRLIHVSLGLLRTVINKLKQERCITPKLIFIKGGQDDATAFENYLIEEQDVDGSGTTSIMGFVSFLEDITQSVLEYIK